MLAQFSIGPKALHLNQEALLLTNLIELSIIYDFSKSNSLSNSNFIKKSTKSIHSNYTQQQFKGIYNFKNTQAQGFKAHPGSQLL